MKTWSSRCVVLFFCPVRAFNCARAKHNYAPWLQWRVLAEVVSVSRQIGPPSLSDSLMSPQEQNEGILCFSVVCLCPFCTCPLWASLVLAVGGMFICVTRVSTRIVKNIKLVLNSSFFCWQLSESSHMLTIEKKKCLWPLLLSWSIGVWITSLMHVFKTVCVCLRELPLDACAVKKHREVSQRWKIHMVHVPACTYTVPASASTDDMWY